MKATSQNKLKKHKVFSLLTIIVGVALLVYMILVEDEPGAVPLLLILAGSGWYMFLQRKVRSQQEP